MHLNAIGGQVKSSYQARFKGNDRLAFLKELQACSNETTINTKAEAEEAVLKRLEEKRLALVKPDGNRLELDGKAMLKLIDQMQYHQSLQPDSIWEESHKGVFFKDLTRFLESKKLMNGFPKTVDCPNEYWEFCISSPQVEASVKTYLENLKTAGFLEMKLWMPAQQHRNGFITEFPKQDDIYLIVTEKGKKWLES